MEEEKRYVLKLRLEDWCYRECMEGTLKECKDNADRIAASCDCGWVTTKDGLVRGDKIIELVVEEIVPTPMGEDIIVPHARDRQTTLDEFDKE